MTCRTPGCTEPAKHRGVCIYCYRNAQNCLARGEAKSWKHLEQLGMVGPSTRPGAPDSLFRKALKERLAQEETL